jgi:hypothetical protein
LFFRLRRGGMGSGREINGTASAERSSAEAVDG